MSESCVFGGFLVSLNAIGEEVCLARCTFTVEKRGSLSHGGNKMSGEDECERLRV